MRHELEPGHLEQRPRRRRQQAEPVDELDLKFPQVVLGFGARNPLVLHQSHVHIRHEIVRDQCGQADFDLWSRRHRGFQVRFPAFPKRDDGPAEQFVVKRESDRVNLAALVFSQQFAGAANLQVVGGQGESRSQFLQGLDGLQALRRIGRQRTSGRGDQVRVGLVV